MAKDDKVLVSFEIEEDLYFKVLQACIDRHETIDEFFEAAIKDLIEKYKEAKKSPAKMKALKQEIKQAKKARK